MDGNNGILPLAYGIAGGETNESLDWFLGNLRDHLMTCGMSDRMSELTFISDRGLPIARGVSTVFPEAFHCFCARHLFASIKTKRTKKLRRWQAIPSTNNLVEVRDGRKNGLVNLADKVCSCEQWQGSGIPCGHVIAAARLFGVADVTQFVSHWFTTETYISTYMEHILPLPHRSEWSDPGPNVLPIVNPPIKPKRAPGRPKSTKRHPSTGEDTEKIVRTCTRCKEPGHNRDTCRSSVDRTGEPTTKRVVKTSASTSKSKKGKEKLTDKEAFHIRMVAR
ncbi:uncharacterized protein [Rutidosis leptorrhynchoides]|uniref:uncharacterized protein n=1 Tax=Rutidosis leptorrhynchoides TaxID=125765 RepID=UPI003A9A6367